MSKDRSEKKHPGISEGKSKLYSIEKLQNIINDCHIDISVSQNGRHRLCRAENMKADADKRAMPEAFEIIHRIPSAKVGDFETHKQPKGSGSFCKA